MINHLTKIENFSTIKAAPCLIDIAGFSLDNYKTFDPTGYTILCNLSKASDGLRYYPNAAKIVLNSNQQSQLVYSFQKFIPNLAKDLQVSEQVAKETTADFFSNNQLVVQPTGLQGKIYKAMLGFQNAIPVMYTSEAVAVLKTTGLSGVGVITQAPLTFVGSTYVGAILFGYMGAVVGNNSVGRLLCITSFVLSRPMAGVEMTLNGLILRPISHIVGLPLILNGTQELIHGKGLSIQDYAAIGVAFDQISNSTLMKKIRKIYKVIREKN